MLLVPRGHPPLLLMDKCCIHLVRYLHCSGLLEGAGFAERGGFPISLSHPLSLFTFFLYFSLSASHNSPSLTSSRVFCWQWSTVDFCLKDGIDRMTQFLVRTKTRTGKQDSACYKNRKNNFETKSCHCQTQFFKRKMRYAASACMVTRQDCIAIAWSYKKVFENM